MTLEKGSSVKVREVVHESVDGWMLDEKRSNKREQEAHRRGWKRRNQQQRACRTTCGQWSLFRMGSNQEMNDWKMNARIERGGLGARIGSYYEERRKAEARREKKLAEHAERIAQTLKKQEVERNGKASNKKKSEIE